MLFYVGAGSSDPLKTFSARQVASAVSAAGVRGVRVPGVRRWLD